MLHITALLMIALMLVLWGYLSDCISSREATATFWPRVEKWNTFANSAPTSKSDEQLDELIAADLSDIDRLIHDKLRSDDARRDNLAEREADLPRKAAGAAARAALAYKINKK